MPQNSAHFLAFTQKALSAALKARQAYEELPQETKASVRTIVAGELDTIARRQASKTRGHTAPAPPLPDMPLDFDSFGQQATRV